MKKILAMLLCLCMMASLFAATALAEEPEEVAGEYRLGLGVSLNTNSSKAGNAQVDATTAAVVLDGEGKIVAVKIDVAQSKMDVTDGQVDTEKEFLTKVELGDDYNMVKYSDATMEWYEQAANFEQYLIGKTAEEVEAIELKEDGEHLVAVDEELYAGCTISIGDFKEAVLKACKDEQGMRFNPKGEIHLGLAIITKADESKAATEDEDGVVKMYSEYAAVVVDDEGVILAALTDATQPQIAIDEDGEIGEVKFGGTKRELKEDYNMVKFSGCTYEWYQQARSFVEFCVGKTAEELRATETKTNEEGHNVFVDEELYATCSISVDGMINVTVKAVNNALGGEYKLGLGVSLNTNSSKAGNAQVDATTAAVVLDGEGKIVAVKIDVAQSKMDVTDGQVDTEKEFLTKVELGDDYNMVKYSDATMEWYEQAANFEQYLIGKTAEEVEAIELKEDGEHLVAVDEELYAGCTISIGDFKEAVLKACKDEQGMRFNPKGEIHLGLAIITKADESKAATEDEDGVVKMYSEYAAVVVDDEGVILAALTDATQPQIAIDEDGEIGEVKFGGTKRELKEDYNMVKFSGCTYEWYQQARSFVEFCLGQTAEELLATETKTNEEGHNVFVDEELYATCSISVDGMINVIAKAAGNALPAAEEKAAA